MKKVSFLTALLCASLMSFATQYCAEPLTLSGGAEINLTCVTVSAGNYQIIIEGTDLNGLGGSFYNPGAVDLRTKITSSTSTMIVCDIEAESAPALYTPLYVMCPGEQNITWPSDIEWGVCSTSKTDPELTINETAVTLSADAPAETFQIQATKADGAGILSYESSNDGIASVSNEGLVTAVGRGIATITVRVAENETFAAASKKLTVTVNGPINWNAVSWLGNGTGDEANTNKYKAVSSPSGMTINNLQSNAEKNCIHVICPSAEFGACSLAANDYHAEGAGLYLHLDAFTAQETQFTLVCGGTTYTFDVYYANGTATAVDNVASEGQTVKVLENGQLVIIRNGMRYNAAGQYLK